MKWQEAALNIASFGYHSYRRSLRLEAELKSLRDSATSGTLYSSGQGLVRVVASDGPDTKRLFKKQNVNMLRSYAENSVWVRAAMDIYRETVGKAQRQIVPDDTEKPLDERVKRDLESLFSRPNQRGIPYSELREEFTEDFLALGHGAMQIGLRRDLSPYELLPVDAALFGFYPDWDGDPAKYRYCLVGPDGKVVRNFYDQQMLALVNRPRSYDVLGLSHVEILDRAVRALLEGDDLLFNQVLSGSPNGALYMGQNSNQPQVDEVRQQIQAVKRAFIIMGNTGEPKYIPFNATPDQMKILDTQTWFARQVAAIFQLSTTRLQFAVDTSRANTDALLTNSQEGPGALLSKIEEAENTQIVGLYGPVEEHNCRVSYPILNQRDEAAQADITKTRLANQPWATINEGRRADGLEPIDLPIADQPLIQTTQGLIPLDVLNATFYSQPQEAQPLALPEPKHFLNRTGKKRNRNRNYLSE